MPEKTLVTLWLYPSSSCWPEWVHISPAALHDLSSSLPRFCVETRRFSDIPSESYDVIITSYLESIQCFVQGAPWL